MQQNKAKNMVDYQSVTNLDHQEFLKLLHSSKLSERRPVKETDRIKGMCENANLIITARYQGKLIGVARSITDYHYCTYLSDLAVDQQFQKSGIGHELIERTKSSYPKAMLILLSAPGAVGFYEKIGMERHSATFYIR